MSKKGGYLIIDLKNKDLISLTNKTFSQDELKEMYDSLEHTYHKHVIISGIVINKIEQNDFITEVYYSKENNEYRFKVYGLIISLTRDDATNKVYITLGDFLTIVSGSTDSGGLIKINYSDFPYRNNLNLLVKLGDTIIQIGFSVIAGFRSYGNKLLYNDTLHTIALSPLENEYFTIIITGSDTANAPYDIIYLG